MPEWADCFTRHEAAETLPADAGCLKTEYSGARTGWQHRVWCSGWVYCGILTMPKPRLWMVALLLFAQGAYIARTPASFISYAYAQDDDDSDRKSVV